MSTAALPRVERPACHRCETFQPECLVPVGDGSRPMCWLCAHLVVEHGASACWDDEHAECGCTAEQIYPPDVIARRSVERLPPPRDDVRDVVTHVIPSFHPSGAIDRTGPRLQVTFERVADGAVVVKSVEPEPTWRSRGRGSMEIK